MLVLYPEKKIELMMSGQARATDLYEGRSYNFPTMVKVMLISKNEVTLSVPDNNIIEVVPIQHVYLFIDRHCGASYSSSAIADGWVLLDDRSDRFFHPGDKMRVNSRQLKLVEEEVTFIGVKLTKSSAEAYFESTSTIYILRSRGASYNMAIEDMECGIPFFNDFRIV